MSHAVEDLGKVIYRMPIDDKDGVISVDIRLLAVLHKLAGEHLVILVTGGEERVDLIRGVLEVKGSGWRLDP